MTAVLNGRHHHHREASAVDREIEALRLIDLWRGRGLTWREVTERLNEKGYRISESSARKIQGGGAVRFA